MDIKKATQRKLQYNLDKLVELEELIEVTEFSISNNAKEHLYNSIKKTKENINYYAEILKALA